MARQPAFPATLTLLLITGVFVSRCQAIRKLLNNQGVDENSLESDICTRLVDQIYKGRVSTAPPSSLVGLWTSQRCEVRPGPEYILRQYQFHNLSHFELRQFYYEDADCTNPSYSLTARGTYEVRGESWTVPGATELDYQIIHVSIVPYTQSTADVLRRTINSTCPMHSAVPWVPHTKYDLYHLLDLEELAQEGSTRHHEDDYIFVEKDCTEDLHFSLHELQLMRLEQQHHHHANRMMLYLGDIHTDRHQRPIYRPTSYQDALLEPKAHGCNVCQKIAKSNEMMPPALKRRRDIKMDLVGEWFSERCESRPNSMFLTRRLLVSSDNRTWKAYYYHYGDALCRQPQFTIFAKGHYTVGLPSSVQYAQEFDFTVTSVSITPDNDDFAMALKEYAKGQDCGDVNWVRGQEKDITPTGGCKALGIVVPHLEYELVKIEKDHHHHKLYLGQRATDNTLSSPQRPTSFQPPLVKCDHAMNFTPPVTYKKHSRLSAAILTRPSVYLLAILVVGILSFI